MAKTIANDITTAYAGFRALLGKIQSNLCDFLLATSTLAIGAVAPEKVLVTNSVDAFIDGKLVAITGAEVALSGTIATATSNVYVIYADSAGTLSSAMGTAGATKDLIVFPTTPDDSVVLGWVLVANASGVDFVGATTSLAAAGITDTYYDTPFPFNTKPLSL